MHADDLNEQTYCDNAALYLHAIQSVIAQRAKFIRIMLAFHQLQSFNGDVSTAPPYTKRQQLALHA
tara:strand:- start:7717 stop:7914 length:198 start_codon:yes stop_codon:yes gene_type:complete